MKMSKCVMSMVLSFLCILQLSLSGCSQAVTTTNEPESYTAAINSSDNIPTSKDEKIDSENNSENYGEAEDIFPENYDENEESSDKDNISVIPNVMGKNYGEAEDIFLDLGLDYTIEYKYVEGVELYKVISQTPNEGTPISSDTVVKLIVCGENKKNVN